MSNYEIEDDGKKHEKNKNTVLDALIALNESIPATAKEQKGVMVIRFTKAEYEVFNQASMNAIRIIKKQSARMSLV